MNWKQSSSEEKVKFLTEQMKQIQQAQALLERYQSFTEKWLKRLKKAEK
jgi:hypothetical protein